MRRFWKRDRSVTDLEDELRAHRADPPDTFVRTLAKRVRGDAPRLRPSFRLSPVYGVALLAVVALVAAGGVGLVTGGSSGASHVISKLASSSSPTNTVTSSSATNQYSGYCGPTPPYAALCVISVSSASATEPKTVGDCTGTMVFNVMLTTKSNMQMSVKYYLKDGTASSSPETGGQDYVNDHPQANPGEVVFPPYPTPGYNKQQITVHICGDSSPKGVSSETFQLYLQLDPAEPGSKIGGTNPATGTIKT